MIPTSSETIAKELIDTQVTLIQVMNASDVIDMKFYRFD